MKSVTTVLLLMVVYIAVSCSRKLPPLRSADLAVMLANEREVSFSLQTPKRDASDSYWRYKLALIPSNGSPVEEGVVVVKCLSSGAVNEFHFDLLEKSSWSNSGVAYIINVSDKIFDDNEMYEVKFLFDKESGQPVKIVLYYLSF